jgi:hypothetical protein|nr:MAG TPA: hypothetical protein [Caudoviricetes sp.]
MSLIQVVTREQDIDGDSIKRMTDGLDALIEKDHDDGVYVTEVDEPKKKRGRPRKSDGKLEMVHVNSDREMSMMETNQPYFNTYRDTTQQLKNTINGIDMMASQIEHDLQMVRASRTLKKKYDYICELTSAAGSLVSNRISAIREINSAITNAHRLDQARMKQNKEIAGVDDDKAIMDMYNAFVNTPVGTMQALPPGFSIPASALNGPNGLAINRNGMTEDQMYDNFVQNPSPEMSAIRMEMNPNIKTVVVYNQETQEKYFDIVDISTGQSVPGIERPSDRLLARMDINLRDGIARNIDANLSYDLVIVGNRRIDEY